MEWNIFKGIVVLHVLFGNVDGFCYPHENTLMACKNNSATGSVIYLDSDGAPANATVKCECIFSHTESNETQTVFVHTRKNSFDGVVFEIDGQGFLNISAVVKVLLESGSKIIFKKTTDDVNRIPALCTGISAGSWLRNFTITCYEGVSFSFPSTTIATLSTTTAKVSTTPPSSTTSSRKTTTTASLSTIELHSSSTMLHRDNAESTNIDQRTDSFEGSIETAQSLSTPATGIIGGAVGGGALIVILVVVAVVAFRNRGVCSDKLRAKRGGHDTDEYVNSEFHSKTVATSETSFASLHHQQLGYRTEQDCITNEDGIDMVVVDDGYERPNLSTEYDIMDTPQVAVDNVNAASHVYENQHLQTSQNVYEQLNKHNISSDANYESLKQI